MLENLAFWLVACLVTPLQGPLMHTCACSSPAHCSWLDLLNSESGFLKFIFILLLMNIRVSITYDKWFVGCFQMIQLFFWTLIIYWENLSYNPNAVFLNLFIITLFGMGEGIFFISLDWHFLAEFLSKLFIFFWRWKLTLIGLFWQTCPACWAF